MAGNLALSGLPIGAALTQPQVPPAGTAPPDPSQIGLWQRFQQRLKDDPNLRMALTTTGLNLLKSPQRGQSGFDVFSNAAQSGIGTLDQLRQRDKAETAAASQQELDNNLKTRQVAATEARVDLARTGQVTSDEQFNRNLQLAREKFEESKKQFEATQSADGVANLTGQERLVNSGIEALVLAQPEIYADTPEGRAKARLVMQEVGGSNNPQGQARVVASLIDNIQSNNLFLDEKNKLNNQQIVQRALETYKIISGDLGSDNPTGDSLDGATASNGNMTGTVRRVGDNQYKLEIDGQLKDRVYTGEQLRASGQLQNVN